MAIIFGTYQGQPVMLDSEHTVIISGAPEAIWRAIRANYREGERIDTQIVADMTFLHRTTVVRNLKLLARYGLVRAELKRPGGAYRCWLVAAKHPSKITPLVTSQQTSKLHKSHNS